MSGEPIVLHPWMMDSGLQAVVGFSLATGSGNGGRSRSLPFELGTAEIYGCCAPRMWAVVRRRAAGRRRGGGRHDNQPGDGEGGGVLWVVGVWTSRRGRGEGAAGGGFRFGNR